MARCPSGRSPVAEIVITFCDRCSPECSVSQKINNHQGRGWAEWSEEHCVVELGWERRGKQIICPDCVEEEVSRG
jgi:hypothetical protein